MKLYQLKTAEDFYDELASQGNYPVSVIMQVYAEHVAKKFAAECVNEALGNKMCVSNSLNEKIDKMYGSIDWNGEKEMYYIQNVSAGYLGNSIIFYGKKGEGYTSNIDKAEVLTKDEAVALLESDQNKWAAWSVDYVKKSGGITRVVDMQFLDYKLKIKKR